MNTAQIADRPRELSDAEVGELDPYAFFALLGKRVIHPGGRTATDHLIRKADFQSGHRVLDVGCGLGRLAIKLASPKREVTGVVHYRNREPVSWYAFAVEIARLWSGAVEVVPVTTAEFPRPAPRPEYSVLDVTRFERCVGRPVEPWEWGLVETLRHLREERDHR